MIVNTPLGLARKQYESSWSAGVGWSCKGREVVRRNCSPHFWWTTISTAGVVAKCGARLGVGKDIKRWGERFEIQFDENEEVGLALCCHIHWPARYFLRRISSKLSRLHLDRLRLTCNDDDDIVTGRAFRADVSRVPEAVQLGNR